MLPRVLNKLTARSLAAEFNHRLRTIAPRKNVNSIFLHQTERAVVEKNLTQLNHD
jgi:hypothetical protein